MDIPTSNHHVGSTERAFVAHVNDLNDFYLHSESVHTSLVKLGHDLYEEYSKPSTKPFGINETFKVGNYCACPSESEDWYRGLIRQLDSNGHAIVFKIDYGDVQCIPVQCLRPLQERFFKLQRLAFHCSLVNLIKPINGWPLDIIDEFRSRVTTTFLYARFINYNEIRDISEVEITEKSSKTPLHKDFEQHQIQRSTSQINDKLVYKYISMETLDSTQPNQIRILYYISPSRFYVYLCEKMNSHMSFQIDLQKAVQNLYPIPSPMKYQPVAAQDNQVVWHRAIVLDSNSNPSKICVYFTDIGQIEYIPTNNIRLLPEEFQRKPAFAVPCSLYNVYPLNGNDPLIWKSNDLVHDELNRLLTNNVTCQVSAKHDQLYYDVEIDIPKIGDLGSFLFDKNLVSRSTMRQSQQRSEFSSGQPPQQSFVRAQLHSSGIPPSRQQQPTFTQPNEYYNNTTQQQTRVTNLGVQNPIVQQSSNIPTNTSSSSSISTVPPQEGFYKIILVRSAAEFYGLSQLRENDLGVLSKHLADYYNNASNDSSLNVAFFMDGVLCVIQEGDKYHRVIIKHRESESRVSIKLVDRGDEIIVDTSELLQIDKKFLSVPAFAQPFRLRGYDESQSSASLTFNLKKLILNQPVHITPNGPSVNGFYPVEVTLNNNQSVNKMLLSNEKNLPVTVPITNNRTNSNQPPPTHITSQVFSNSSRHHSTMGHDSGGRLEMGHRTSDVLPPPQKILTGAARTQPGRFASTANQIPPSTEQPARFSNIGNRNPQAQPIDSTPPNPTWNKDQNNKPSFSGSGLGNQQTFGRQQADSSQFGMNQRTDDNKPTMMNNQNRFTPSSSDNPPPSSFEQKRSFNSGFSHDDRHEKPTSGNHFHQNNESGFRRGAVTNRGEYSDRGGRGGFNERHINRNNEENNNESNAQSSGGFSRRTRDFTDRGGRGGNFQERGGTNRNQGDDQSQNFSHNRGEFHGARGGGGGFSYRRDQGENGDFGRRGSRGDSRGGRFNSSSGGGFGNRDNTESRFNSDTKTFSAWSNTQSTPANFEAGDRFIESEIPKEAFQFVVSYVEAANNFFIQLFSKADEITALSETLQTEYKQSPGSNLNSFQKDQACLAKSSDGCWYRAMVLSTGLSKLKIRFIDFGDTRDVDSNTIRQIAKKNCSPGPYAYPCIFKDAKAVENVNTASFINQCAEKQFTGKITTKTSDGKFILESENLLNILLELIPIKLKSEVKLKRVKCIIAHIEPEQQEFNIQDDETTLDKIAELIENEETNAPTLSLDELKQLEPKSMVIARYEDMPYRGIIESDQSEDNVNICFIDYGNTSSCPKNSLKRCSEQLSSYPYQAKHCHLYGVSSNQINNALEYLGEKSDPENNHEIAIINEKNQIYNVLVYIDNQCINEKFGYNPNNDQSSTTAKEQEQLSSGTEQLSAGTKQLSSGTEQLSAGTKQLSSGTEQLSSETEKLSSGTEQLSSETEKISSGTEQLSSETEKLSSGTEQLSSETEQLSSGTEQLSSETEKLSSGTEQLSSETEKLSSGTEQPSSETEKLSSGAEQLSSETEQLSSGTEQPSSETEKLSSGTEQLSSETEQLSSGTEQLTSGTEQLSSETEQLSSGTEQLSSGTEQLSSGTEQLTSGTEQVSSETEQLSPGTEQLSAGTEQPSSGTEQPSSGTEQLSAGTEQPSSGTEQLSSGTEQQTNEDVLSPNESSLGTPKVIKSETEETSSKYRQGLLTHIEKSKPYVYLQFIPESESIIDQINELIETITKEDKHNSSYQIGDHIIAKFTEDDNYYRARIESYSSSTTLYTVYFLDYGNLDENVPLDSLYSYSDDLTKIEPQAHGYLLETINSETWDNVVRSLIEEKLNEVIDFYFSDENNSIIHIKLDNEQIESTPIEPIQTFQANISATDNDCFYIHILPDGNLHACEMEERLQICNRERKDSWSMNDLCIVSNEENRYYRGQILAIDEKKYVVKCIDYGTILRNITDDHLYVLPDEETFKQSSLAQQCRLHGVDDENQRKAIEEVIKNIPSSERVTITVENDRKEQCLFVTLARGNNEIINDRYLLANNDTTENEHKQESDNDEKNEEIKLPDSPDSAIADTVNTDEQLPLQNEHTNPSNEPMNITENNSSLSMTNNQTIDFGENDLSTTMKDETNQSISSN